MITTTETPDTIISDLKSLNSTFSTFNENEDYLRQLALKSLAQRIVVKHQKPPIFSISSTSDESSSINTQNSKDVSVVNELELRKKALLSFSKRLVNANKRSASSPNLQSIEALKKSNNEATVLPEKQPISVQPRFVVTLSALSDDSDDNVEETDMPSVTINCASSSAATIIRRVQTTVSISKATTVCVMTPSQQISAPPPLKSLPAPCSSTTSAYSLDSYKKLVVKQTEKLEQLKTTLKRHQKVLLERKNAETNMQASVLTLQAKLRRAIQMQSKARLATTKAVKQKSLTVRELQSTEEQLQRINSIVERIARKSALKAIKEKRLTQQVQKLSNNLTKSQETPPLDLKVITRYFVTLVENTKASYRIVSPFFTYFSMNSLLKPPEHNLSPHNKFPLPTKSSFDVFTPICPFFLDGNCIDVACKFQHLGIVKFTKTTFNSIGPLNVGSQSPFLNERSNCVCPVCNTNLEINSDAPESCQSVADWHVIYANKLSNNQNWSNLLTPSPQNNDAFLDHCLYAVFQLHKESLKQVLLDAVFNILSKSNFSVHLVSRAISSPRLDPLPFRRLLLCKSLLHLLSQAHCYSDNFIKSASLIKPITTVTYYICRVEWESCGSLMGLELVDKMLASDRITCHQLPLAHPARWGIWYLRMLLQLSPSFPQTHLISFSSHCAFYDPVRLAAQADLFRIAEEDLALPHGFHLFLNDCMEHPGVSNVEFSMALSFSHLYVQFLAASGQFERAAAFCVSIFESNESLLGFDNLFFPSAVHFSNLCLQQSETTAFDLVSDLANREMPIRMQTEFAFLFACLMQQMGKPELASSLLGELVGGLIPLDSLEPPMVYSGFLDLLPSDGDGDLRNAVYLWMCCGLYSIIHSFATSLLPTFLLKLPAYLMEDYSTNKVFPFPFVSLLLHLGLRLAESLISPVDYESTVKILLLPDAFTRDANFCSNPPSWFLEILQHVNISKFTEDHPPYSLCVQLVETYGYRVVKALLVGLTHNGHFRLLQSLCTIARLERPVDELFWLTLTALGVYFSPLNAATDHQNDTKWQQTQLQSYLIDCFTDALSILPHSCLLWQHFALSIRDCFPDTSSETIELRAHIQRKAVEFGLEEVVTAVFSQAVGQTLPCAYVASLAYASSEAWWLENTPTLSR